MLRTAYDSEHNDVIRYLLENGYVEKVNRVCCLIHNNNRADDS